MCVCVCARMCICSMIEGGEDSQDPLSCRSFSTKEPLNIGHFCRKGATMIRDRVSLRHPVSWHGVALASRIDKIIGLFCRRALYKRRYSAKETCNLIDPTDYSHPISCFPKLQIIYHKRAIKYRSLLRKMTFKDKGSYASSPPHILSLIQTF